MNEQPFDPTVWLETTNYTDLDENTTAHIYAALSPDEQFLVLTIRFTVVQQI